MAPSARLSPPVTLRNGVSSRRLPGKSSAVGTPVAGSTAYPGGGSVVVSIRPRLSAVAAPTASAAIRGQRSFWK